MIDYKDLKMKCTSSHPQEPFFTEGKEYEIIKNLCGYAIVDNDGEVPEYGTTPFELEQYLNEFWDSNFKLVNIDERTKIRKTFQRTLIQYNMDIGHLSGHLIGKPSNVISAQIAMLKVKREAIQELYDEVFKGGNE
ncbi:hypothetical protein OLACOIGA_00019 [Enterococcus phage vB_Efa29212_2e]|nr:hypothetical protein OLACOIGA_00019 [Enterococcus phage vB_Efa29212_2e]